MMDHSENTLRAAIKALRETVVPAVDPNDPQAVEQLGLTIEFLEHLRARIYDIHGRERAELGNQLALARRLIDDAGIVPDDVRVHLERSWSEASKVHADAAAHTEDLRGAIRRLGAAARGVIRTVRNGPEEVRDRVGAHVMSGIESSIEADSMWYSTFRQNKDAAAAGTP
ncbi:hypothetical protein [Nocardia miyunensis]|uniref:hypothetical protein n=1 Tax=Nocardia miyunensis TaxID=282684 RepID=UPI000AC33F68|nr:hypothetical protein [Nocardia miyunensis]